MFIYRITVIPLNQSYIGLDTKPEYKKSRWKSHCKESESGSTRKIHLAMSKYGITNCFYEVIERGFTTIGQLALAEIDQIKQHDSYANGLNSTPGGDGLGRHDLSTMTELEIEAIRLSLGESFTEYNKKKWHGLSLEEKQEKTAHLHTKEVISARANTLKEFYKNNPDAASAKSAAIERWQAENKKQLVEQNKKNGLLGSAKMSKPVIVETVDGRTEIYESRSSFQRETKLWFSTLVDKSKNNEYYKGYKLKDSK